MKYIIYVANARRYIPWFIRVYLGIQRTAKDVPWWGYHVTVPICEWDLKISSKESITSTKKKGARKMWQHATLSWGKSSDNSVSIVLLLLSEQPSTSLLTITLSIMIDNTFVMKEMWREDPEQDRPLGIHIHMHWNIYHMFKSDRIQISAESFFSFKRP